MGLVLAFHVNSTLSELHLKSNGNKKQQGKTANLEGCPKQAASLISSAENKGRGNQRKRFMSWGQLLVEQRTQKHRSGFRISLIPWVCLNVF